MPLSLSICIYIYIHTCRYVYIIHVYTLHLTYPKHTGLPSKFLVQKAVELYDAPPAGGASPGRPDGYHYDYYHYYYIYRYNIIIIILYH